MTERRKKVRRRRRERMPSSLRVGILITVLFFVVVAAGVLMVPALNVSEIYCEGCINTNQTDIIMASRLQTDSNILLAKVGRAEREIKKIPIIEDVTVRRVFPDKLCITISERTPAAYIMKGGECVAIDTEGFVLEIISDSRAGEISKNNTPVMHPDIDEGKEDFGDAEEVVTDQTANEEDKEEPQNMKMIYSIPLIDGIEIDGTKEGREIKAVDKDKLEKLIKVCNALNDAGLLNRATYIDMNNITDVILFIENRLEVQIGATDNIEYRMKFLAEVINTKISAFEKAVMDYRGDDIYVRSPEDGKARTIMEESDSEEDAEEEETETE